MNALFRTIDLTVGDGQIEEVILSLFHTILLQRTVGKIHYKDNSNYSVGVLGFTEVDCDFVEFTYVRSASEELDKQLKKEAAMFHEELLRSGSNSGQITLEFYQKNKKSLFAFGAWDPSPWEVWTVKLQIVSPKNAHEQDMARQDVGELLCQKIYYIAEAMNNALFVPKFPKQEEFHQVFNDSFTDIEPYHFKIIHQTMSTSASVGKALTRLVGNLQQL